MYLHASVKIHSETHNHVDLAYANKKILLKSQVVLNNIIKLWVGDAGVLIVRACGAFAEALSWLPAPMWSGSQLHVIPEESILHFGLLYCCAYTLCHTHVCDGKYMMKSLKSNYQGNQAWHTCVASVHGN